MGVAVAAAGSLAGGLAGQAIMGKPQVYTGGGIPGVTATKAQGGKGGDKGGIPQVDPTYALEMFKQAAATQTAYYKEGLQYYEKAIKEASNTAIEYYNKANETLRPLSEASTAAMNEQLKMLGLDPISKTAGLSKQVAALSDRLPEAGALAAELTKAEAIKDPQARAAAKQQLSQQYQALVDKYNVGDVSKLSAYQPLDNNQMSPEFYRRLQEKARNDTSNMNDYYTWIDQLKSAPQWEGYRQSVRDQIQKEHKEAYQAQLDAATGKPGMTYEEAVKLNTARNEVGSQLQELAGQFQAGYAETPETGYTGAQVEQRLASTPGYQWQMEQGTRAIERQGAARGMLGSANTQIALQEYGQGLAMNTYQGYMQNLANIVNQGSGATVQIANNQVNQGQYLGGLIEARGDAQNQTSQLIGNAQAESMYKQGQLFYDASKFNTQLQYGWLQADKGREASLMQSAINSAPANQAVQLAQSKFNYNVFQNQQGGQGFLQGQY